MSNTRWVVTVSKQRKMQEVSQDLLGTGFKVDNVLEAIGVFTGVGNDETASKMRAVPGVSDVSPELPADVGPPNSSETW